MIKFYVKDFKKITGFEPDHSLVGKDDLLICPKCSKNPAILTQYGIMNCEVCNMKTRQDLHKYGSAGKEWIPDRIKDDRRRYFKDTVQPYRNGKLSKEFVDSYPKEAHRYGSAAEIASAKHVWKDLPGWKENYGRG